MIKIGDLIRSEVSPLNQFEFQATDIYSRVMAKISPDAIADMSPRYIGVEVELEKCVNSNLYKNGDLAGYKELERQLISKYSDTGPMPGIPFKSFWKLTADGSLRNSGMEFVSKYGTTFKNLAPVLLALDDYLSVFDPLAEANHRTGLHLHVDVRDMSLKDLQRLLMLYALYEDAIFNYSGGRQKNIFCVPLSETDLPLSHLIGINDLDSLNAFIRNHTRKYMGLNLKPIGEQGSIEFRMHYGTRDLDKIYDWAFVIHSLFRAVIEGPWARNDRLFDEISKINTLKEYRDFAMVSFHEAYPFLRQYLTEQGMEKGLSFVKEISIDEEKLPDELKLYKTKTKLQLSRGRKKKGGAAFNRLEQPIPRRVEAVRIPIEELERLERFAVQVDPAVGVNLHAFDLEEVPPPPPRREEDDFAGWEEARIGNLGLTIQKQRELANRMFYTIYSMYDREKWNRLSGHRPFNEVTISHMAALSVFGSIDMLKQQLPGGIPRDQRTTLPTGAYVNKNSLLVVWDGLNFGIIPAYKFNQNMYTYVGVFLHNGEEREGRYYPYPMLARHLVEDMRVTRTFYVASPNVENGVGDHLFVDDEIVNNLWQPIEGDE